MVVDSSILEKLRHASQQYNNKKKQLATRVDSWHCLSQSDSQAFPSTQACTSIHPTQPTRNRFPSSQWEMPLNDMKMSQATSSTRHSVPPSILSFDAYCQTEVRKCDTGRTVSVCTSPIRPTRLLVSAALSPTVISAPHAVVRQTQTIEEQRTVADAQVFKHISTLSEKVDAGFRDVLATLTRTGETSKTRTPDTEEDELVYLSFLFEHDQTVLKLFDAPTGVKETSCKPPNRGRPPTRKRACKSHPVALNQVKEDDDVAPPTIQPPFTSALKRARFTT